MAVSRRREGPAGPSGRRPVRPRLPRFPPGMSVGSTDREDFGLFIGCEKKEPTLSFINWPFCFEFSRLSRKGETWHFVQMNVSVQAVPWFSFHYLLPSRPAIELHHPGWLVWMQRRSTPAGGAFWGQVGRRGRGQESRQKRGVPVGDFTRFPRQPPFGLKSPCDGSDWTMASVLKLGRYLLSCQTLCQFLLIPFFFPTVK